MVGTSTRVCGTILRTFMLMLCTVVRYNIQDFHGALWHNMGVCHGCGYFGTIRGTFMVGTMVL